MVAIRLQLDEKNPQQALDDRWWILVHVISDIIHTVNINLKSPQGNDTLLYKQNNRLTMCAQDLRAIIAASRDSGSDIGVFFQAAINELPLTVNFGYTKF